MGNDSNRELAENKLILLYILHKVDMPISNQQIVKFILENKFMNYFSLQEYLNELYENNYVVNTDYENRNCYVITQKGIETLNCLSSHIPRNIKSYIDSNLKNIKKNVKNEFSITANFTAENENEFIVNCKIKEESFELININLLVGSQENANKICSNWKNHAEYIYADIIENLIKKRDISSQ